MKAAALLLELLGAVRRERAAARITTGLRLTARTRRTWCWGLAVLGMVTFAASMAFGQVNPQNMSSGILNAYQASKAPALVAFNQYAGRLFRALALVEMAWAAILLALERSDLQSWMAGFLRKFFVLSFFLYLLQRGPFIADAIVDSFTTVGVQVAGMPGGASPGNIFLEGVDLAGTLLKKANWTGFMFNPAPTIMVILSALIMFLSFIVITCHYIMAQVESYIVVSAGLIFLGFGGHSVTRPYVERFFSLAVAVGVKLMVLYVVIGVGRVLTQNWVAFANNLSITAFPITEVLNLVGGCVIYAAVAWGVPKFAAGLLAGSPAFGGGDLVHMGMAGLTTGLMAAGGAGLALRGAAALGGAAGGAGTSGGIASAANVSSMGGRGPGGPPGPSGAGGAPGRGGGPGGGSGGGGGGVDGAYSPSQPAPPGGAGAANAGPTPTGASSGGGSLQGSAGSMDGGASGSTNGASPGASQVPPPLAPGAGIGGSESSATVPRSVESSTPPPLPPADPGSVSGGGVRQPAPPSTPSNVGMSTAGVGRGSGSHGNREDRGAARANLGGGTGASNPPSSRFPSYSSGAPAGSAGFGSGYSGGGGRGATRGGGAGGTQPPPPSGWEKLDRAGATLLKGVRNAEHVAYLAARLIPPDGGAGGSPPQMNIHGE